MCFLIHRVGLPIDCYADLASRNLINSASPSELVMIRRGFIRRLRVDFVFNGCLWAKIKPLCTLMHASDRKLKSACHNATENRVVARQTLQRIFILFVFPLSTNLHSLHHHRTIPARRYGGPGTRYKIFQQTTVTFGRMCAVNTSDCSSPYFGRWEIKI